MFKRLLEIFTPGYSKKNSDDIYGILLPSVLGICLCAFCLVGGTYAWFTGSISTPAQSIQSGDYTVAPIVTVENADTVTVLEANDQGKYTLSANQEYKITLTAKGTATSGYCILSYPVQDEKVVLHTQQIAPGENNGVFFTVKTDQKIVLTITSQWGTSSWNSLKPDEILKNGGIYLLDTSASSETQDPVVNDSPADPQPNASVPNPELPNVPSEELVTPEEPTVPVEPTENADVVPSGIVEPVSLLPSEEQDPLEEIVHIVLEGESLSKIADQYGCSVEELVLLNNIEDPNTIYVGQKIIIPQQK